MPVTVLLVRRLFPWNLASHKLMYITYSICSKLRYVPLWLVPFSTQGLLKVLQSNTQYGDTSFSVYAATFWSSLPVKLRLVRVISRLLLIIIVTLLSHVSLLQKHLIKLFPLCLSTNQSHSGYTVVHFEDQASADLECV